MYIEGMKTRLSIFFNCVLRKQKDLERKREKKTKGIRKKRKNRACVLNPYQDVLVFSKFEDIIND